MKAALIVGIVMGASALVLPAAGFAQGAAAIAVEGKGANGAVKAGEIEVRAKIVELDMKNRVAVLRGPKGNIVMVDVPAEVKGLDQVRVGDDLVFRYAAAVVAKLEKVSGTAGIRENTEKTETVAAPAGALPGRASARTVEVLATITALNAKAGTATLRGASRTTTVNVPKDIDIKQLKVGDEVRATVIEAVVLNVERPAAK
ncbi:hypothetical protein [Variovorax sp. HJSM1_2]|uniref:hypothetical protein n=1 Tax=Variovorax sp. HJSM1_2 TaxID=3366263 RepID=UPI003BEB4186